VVKLPWPSAFGTEARQEGPVGPELLKSMIVEISSEDIALRPDGDAGDGFEPTIERTGNAHGERATPFIDRLSRSIEDLDAVGIAVRDGERAIPVERDIGRIDKCTSGVSLFIGDTPLTLKIPSALSCSTR
jgi:hypothetical protein